MKIYNCHVHIGTNDSVPKKFIPIVSRFLMKSKVTAWLGRAINKITFWSSNDVLDRSMAFLNIANYESQQKIFEQLKGYYSDNTVFCPQQMDMEFMRAGKIKQSFADNIQEITDLKAKYPDNLMPFIAVDPRRENIFDIVKDAIENRGFAGIKIYPSLGYFPQDERLYPIYEYCQKNNIPVMSHCGIDGAVHLKKIKDADTNPFGVIQAYKNKWNTFTDPDNWDIVAELYPDLKICLAHMGGGSEVQKYMNTSWQGGKTTWFNKIKNLIEKHKNVYTDTSYTMHDVKLHSLLSILLEDEKIKHKILYGSDFYMVVQKDSERQFSMDLRVSLGEEKFKLIAETNPEVFLNVKKENENEG